MTSKLLKQLVALSAFIISLINLAMAQQAVEGANESVTAPKSFKVLSWNLEHFTDPFDNPYINNDMDDMGSTKSDAVLQLLAEAIVRIDADVMAFQEVESSAALKFFLDEYLEDHEYKFYAGLPSMEWHQNVVVVSKFPLGAITSFREVIVRNPESNSKALNIFSNRLMAVEVNPTEESSFILANVHLKAGRDPQDPLWRINMAKVMKEGLVEMQKSHPAMKVVWAGDMNCTPGSREYRYLTEEDDPKLIDVMAPLGHAPSHPANAPKSQLDYIFVNEAMEGHLVPNSFGPARPLSLKEMASISDHLPMVASFEVE